jgi:hypothetical protein
MGFFDNFENAYTGGSVTAAERVAREESRKRQEEKAKAKEKDKKHKNKK